MRIAIIYAVLFAGCGKKATQDVEPEPEPKKAVAAKQHEPNIIILGSDNIANFIDHTKRYKGKTLRATLTIESPIFAREDDSLRNYADKDVRFFRIGPDAPQLQMVIRMPKDSLPNAHFGHEVVVTFVCKEGNLRQGNVATHVRRP